MPDSNFYTDPEDIFSWLDLVYLENGVDSVHIKDNGIVNVDGSVEISLPMKQLPVRFGTVRDKFTLIDCDNLESLTGCPIEVTDFICSRNAKLKNLIGAPNHVEGFLTCTQLPSLTSLEGFPAVVKRSVNISNNPSLTQLGHLPAMVSELNCSGCDLYSLKGSPQEIIGSFRCYNNYYLNSIEGLPKTIWYAMELSWTKTLPLLRLFYVKRINKIVFHNPNPDSKNVQNMINKYLSLGVAGMMPCAAELIKAGYKENAKL